MPKKKEKTRLEVFADMCDAFGSVIMGHEKVTYVLNDKNMGNKIRTIEELYQHYLKLVKLNEINMHEIQRIETRRAFFGCAGLLMIMQRDELSELPEEKAIDELERMHNEVSEFWKTNIAPGAFDSN